MTTDTQLAPTDAEIDALELLREIHSDLLQAAIPNHDDPWWQKASAVLAKRGARPAPASAAAFALQALVAAGHVSQELVDKAMALPGAPQPAHSGEPVAELSVDRFTTQLKALPASHDVRPYGTHKLYTTPLPTQAQAGAVPLTDEQWQRIADLTDSILTRATKDEIERVIGIKGGQQ